MANKPRSKAGGNTRNRPPLEKHVTAAILKYLNSVPGCYAIKTYGSAYGSGQPDIIGCHGGQAFAFEVKRPGPKPISILHANAREDWIEAGATPLQAATLEKWQRAGTIVGVVTSVEEVRELLRQLLEEGE